MPTKEQKTRLADVLGWVKTAKENLPAINDGVVTSDAILQLSALLDRMHRIATSLQNRTAVEQRRRAA